MHFIFKYNLLEWEKFVKNKQQTHKVHIKILDKQGLEIQQQGRCRLINLLLLFSLKLF